LKKGHFDSFPEDAQPTSYDTFGQVLSVNAGGAQTDAYAPAREAAESSGKAFVTETVADGAQQAGMSVEHRLIAVPDQEKKASTAQYGATMQEH